MPTSNSAKPCATHTGHPTQQTASARRAKWPLLQFLLVELFPRHGLKTEKSLSALVGAIELPINLGRRAQTEDQMPWKPGFPADEENYQLHGGEHQEHEEHASRQSSLERCS